MGTTGAGLGTCFHGCLASLQHLEHQEGAVSRDSDGASQTPASFWSCVLSKPLASYPLTSEGAAQISLCCPIWTWAFPPKWQERHNAARLYCPPPLHPTSAYDQALPPIKAQGLPAGLQTRQLLQHVKEKGWQTPPGAIGMSCLGFTLLEGGGDVIDTVVVCADTHSRVPIAKAGGASCGVSGIQVVEVSLAPGKTQEDDNVQVRFLLFLASTTSLLMTATQHSHRHSSRSSPGWDGETGMQALPGMQLLGRWRTSHTVVRQVLPTPTSRSALRWCSPCRHSGQRGSPLCCQPGRTHTAGSCNRDSGNIHLDFQLGLEAQCPQLLHKTAENPPQLPVPC